MATTSVADLRNVVLLGHAGAGKTTLGEAILHKAGLTNRLGSVDEKSSILDADEEERLHGHSIDAGLAHLNHEGKEINLIDTPGYPEFIGAALTGMAAAETAVVVVSASAGIQMNTRRLFQAARDRGMACAIIVNKIDAGGDDLAALVEALRESFGNQCVPANLPRADGKGVIDCLHETSGEAAFGDVGEAHTNLMETIIEADEALMESYLGGEDVSAEKLAEVFTKALTSQTLVPILFTSGRSEVGVTEFLDFVAQACPDPAEGVKLKLAAVGEEATSTEVAPDANGEVLGLVIRVSYDPRSNIKYSTVRLQRGKLKSDTALQATGGKRGMRAGAISKLQGDRLDHLEEAQAGDIVTLAKLEELRILDTIFSGGEPGRIETPPMPTPMYSLAIEPKSRGDETKISAVLGEVSDSDPTFVIDRDRQTNEQIISAIGELHIRVNLERMKNRRGLDVNTKPPQIPYRETVTSAAKLVEYTHKKQSGGAGQFARVFINMEPNERGAGYEFVDKIFGGSIDQSFRPSVDKGCQAAMVDGVMAGFPVVDVKVSLVDGKTHPVDSKDIAFQIAGREAFRKAFMQAKPILLEPIVNMEVTVPTENVGDITGDLSSRRGRVQGQDVLPGNLITIKAQVPLAEVQQYNSQLKSVTGGQGSFTMDLSHYEPVPPNVVQQIVAQRKTKEEE